MTRLAVEEIPTSAMKILPLNPGSLQGSRFVALVFIWPSPPKGGQPSIRAARYPTLGTVWMISGCDGSRSILDLRREMWTSM